jgi:hypothetical protein
MASLPKKPAAKWLPRIRYVADAVPAAALMQILGHERRIMPASLRAHLTEFEREAEAWRRRKASDPQDAAATKLSAAGRRARGHDGARYFEATFRGRPVFPVQARPMRTIGRWLSAGIDHADYLLTVARLWALDRLAPMPDTPVDRAIREEAERLRKAFPTIDFDNPGSRRSRV